MELNVGRLIPAEYLPEEKIITKLEKISRQKRFDPNLIDKIRDPRLTKKQFEIVLKNELLELYKWLLRRIVFSAGYNQKKNSGFFKRVYVFLPGQAIAIHLLRRAIPFACLGIPVYCFYKSKTVLGNYELSNKVFNWLGLNNKIKALKQNPKKSLPRIDKPNNLFVITGKQESFFQIKTELKKASLVGATGRCSILVTDSVPKARRIKKLLCSHIVENSCTTLKATFIIGKSFSKFGLIKGIENNKKQYSFSEILSRLRPTIIFSNNSSDIKRWTDQYCIKPISLNATTKDIEGLAKDPICGWPGDYLL